MENGILKWYHNQIKKNIPVTSGDIRKKAIELSKFEEFTASKTWFRKFKVRNSIVVTRTKRGVTSNVASTGSNTKLKHKQKLN